MRFFKLSLRRMGKEGKPGNMPTFGDRSGYVQSTLKLFKTLNM